MDAITQKCYDSTSLEGVSREDWEGGGYWLEGKHPSSGNSNFYQEDSLTGRREVKN